MSRAGYTADGDDRWVHIRWRGAVESATRGERGQRLLRDLLAGLDSMQEKALYCGELETADGERCALGVAASVRSVRFLDVDPEAHDRIARALDIAPALAREIAYINDEGGPWAYDETPEQRYARVRRWVVARLRAERCPTTV